MNTRAFITGVSGTELNAAEREFIARRAAMGLYSIQAEYRDAGASSCSGSGTAQDVGRPRGAGPDRPGGRPGAAAWPAALAGLSGRSGVRRALRHRSGARPDRGPAERAADRGGSSAISASPSIACRWRTCRSPARDAVIGNRAYGTEPGKVAAIARAVTEGLEQGGILPVLKHIPGHGRATADTHFRLPVVDTPRAELEADRFRRVSTAGGPADGDDRTCCV